MIACDASLRFASVEGQGLRFDQAGRAFTRMRAPFFTSEACLAEAMYLAGSRIGWSAQKRLWRLVGSFWIVPVQADMDLIETFMERYRDVPMDFADATLVALASENPQIRVATFDSNFLAYRRADGTPVPLVDDRLLGWP